MKEEFEMRRNQLFSSWPLWLALILFIITISLIFSYNAPDFLNVALDKTPIGTAYRNPGPIVQAITIAISVNSTLIFDFILDIFFYLGIHTLDDRLERICQILILVIPSYVSLNAEHSPHFLYLSICMHSIQVAGSLIPVFSLLTRLLPKIFTMVRTVLSFLCFAFAFSLALIYVRDPAPVWYAVLVVVSLFSSQAILAHMLYMWWQSLLVQSKSNRIEDLLQFVSSDELCCIIYLLFSHVVIILFHMCAACGAKLCWSNVSLPELLIGIYTLAGYSMLSSCVPNRVLQYLALKQKIQLKSNHTAIRYISHEIRSPMNIVQNGVRLAKDDLQKGCPISDVIENLIDVEHACLAATSILDDLLHFEKIENGNFVVEPKLQMARPYLLQICNDCRILAEQKNIQYSVEDCLPPSSLNSKLEIAILVDTVRFEQVVRNLIVNAAKFTPAGGFISVNLKCSINKLQASSTTKKEHRKESISISSLKTNQFKVHCETQLQNDPIPASKSTPENSGKVVIEIRDNGVGMSKLQLNQVFGQFVQFNANFLQGGGGSGLGLWICNEIVKQHKGTITVSSDGEGHGTTFSVELDCFLYEKNQHESHNTGQMISNTRVSNQSVAQSLSVVQYTTTCQKKPYLHLQDQKDSKEACEHYTSIKILVVDDSSLNRKYLMKMLKKVELEFQGQHNVCFHFTEAEDGYPALKKMEDSLLSTKFNIVFMDNIMIHLNGPETASKMRHQYNFNGKIVGVTGNSDKVDVLDFIDKGADCVLIKPIMFELLRESILGSIETICSEVV